MSTTGAPELAQGVAGPAAMAAPAPAAAPALAMTSEAAAAAIPRPRMICGCISRTSLQWLGPAEVLAPIVRQPVCQPAPASECCSRQFRACLQDLAATR